MWIRNKKKKDKAEASNSRHTVQAFSTEDICFVEDNGQFIPIRLDTIIGKGGESVVRTLQKSPKDTPHPSKKYEGLYVAKIYNHGATAEYVRKLKKLIDIWHNHGKSLSGFCFPRFLIYDNKSGGNCMGFLMPRYDGFSLSQIFDCFLDQRKTNRLLRPTKLRNIENEWTRAELSKLALNILEKLSQLHRWGIYMCDINTRNILTNENQDALFIDVDSYQVDTCGCPVYRPEFASPRLVEMGCPKDELQTPDDENFSIAVLLFHILFVGQHPYVRSSGEDTFEQHIKNRKFAYPLTYDTTSFIPKGPWQNIWYSLPFDLRECFHSAFTSDQYPDISRWIQVLREYKENIDANRLNRSIFPQTNTLLEQSQLYLGNIHDVFDDIAETEPDRAPGLRQFETEISSSTEPRMLVLEFGSESIRSHTTNKNGEWYMRPFITNHFSCIDKTGMMDTAKLRESLEALHIRDCIEHIPGPAITHVIALGGICLRGLANCHEVVDLLEHVTGFPFGVLTSSEEAVMIAQTAIDNNPHLSSEPTLIIDVGGLATDLISRAPDGHVTRHTFPRLGSCTLTNWLYSINLRTSNLKMVFEGHDNSVNNFDWGEGWDIPATTMVGIGALVRLLGKKESQRWFTIEELEKKKDEITDELTLNRPQISALYDDIKKSHNRYAARDTTLRLALPIYICLMKHLHIQKIHVQRFGLGSAYINTQVKHSQLLKSEPPTLSLL